MKTWYKIVILIAKKLKTKILSLKILALVIRLIKLLLVYNNYKK